MSFATGNVGVNLSSGQRSATARAVMLLALAVVLAVGILHSVDDGENGRLASSSNKQPASAPASSVAPVTSTSTTPARTPAQVNVLVANGTGINGVGAQLANKIRPNGYTLLTPTNTTAKVTASQVQYQTGYQAEAEAIASLYGLATAAVVPLTVPAPVGDVGAANVIVIAGDELAATVASSSSSTTTTTRPAMGGPLSNSSVPATNPIVVPTTTTVAR